MLSTNKLMKIVVIGANGRQGEAAVKALSNFNQFDVIGTVRDPSKGKGIEHLPRVNVVIADVDDYNSISKAFQQVDGVFFYNPNAMKLGMKTIKQRFMNLDRALRENNVKYLVLSLGIAVRPNSGVSLLDNYLKLIDIFKQNSQLQWCIINPSGIMDDILSPGDPSSCHTYTNAIKLSSLPFGWISTEDIGITVAKVFMNPETHANQTIDMIADIATGPEITQLMSRLCQRPYQYINGDLPWVLNYIYPSLVNLFIAITKPEFTQPILQKYKELNPAALTLEAFLLKNKIKERTFPSKPSNCIIC